MVCTTSARGTVSRGELPPETAGGFCEARDGLKSKLAKERGILASSNFSVVRNLGWGSVLGQPPLPCLLRQWVSDLPRRFRISYLPLSQGGETQAGHCMGSSEHVSKDAPGPKLHFRHILRHHFQPRAKVRRRWAGHVAAAVKPGLAIVRHG